MKEQAKQHIGKLRAKHQDELDAAKNAVFGDGGDEGRLLGQVKDELASTAKRVMELENQIAAAQESTAKVKGDAKKYIETLKKKEQVMSVCLASVSMRLHLSLSIVCPSVCMSLRTSWSLQCDKRECDPIHSG